MNKNKKHSFHLVTPSPWPIMTSLGLMITVTGLTMYMHFYENGGYLLIHGLVLTIGSLTAWWRDVIREGTYEGMHTKLVQKGLRLGVALFIISEAMFFFSLFWAHFHVSLDPSIEIGAIWPPAGIKTLDPLGIPLLNTYLLLLSGVTITATHHYLIRGFGKQTREGFLYTIGLALSFTALQVYEYIEAPFSISDGIYGSTFYMTTGFHGLHVIIGTIFIAVCFGRFLFGHFTKQHHVGFEAAIWYWHFVDVVWVGLYLIIYIYSSL